MSTAIDPNDLEQLDFDLSESQDVGPVGPLDVLRFTYGMYQRAGKLKGDPEEPMNPFTQKEVGVAANVCAEMDKIDDALRIIPSKYDPGLKLNVPFELLVMYRAMMFRFISEGMAAAHRESWYKLGFYLSFCTLMGTWLVLLIK